MLEPEPFWRHGGGGTRALALCLTSSSVPIRSQTVQMACLEAIGCDSWEHAQSDQDHCWRAANLPPVPKRGALPICGMILPASWAQQCAYGSYENDECDIWAFPDSWQPNTPCYRTPTDRSDSQESLPLCLWLQFTKYSCGTNAVLDTVVFDGALNVLERRLAVEYRKGGQCSSFHQQYQYCQAGCNSKHVVAFVSVNKLAVGSIDYSDAHISAKSAPTRL